MKTHTTPEEIVDAFRYVGEGYPREAVDAALAARDEVAPRLIDALRRHADNPSAPPGDSDFVAIFAVMLLAHWRFHPAHKPMIEFLSHSQAFIDSHLGDLVTEGLPAYLWATSDGETELLCELTANRNAGRWSRIGAVTALKMTVAAGQSDRAEMADTIAELLRAELDNPPAGLVAEYLCSTLADVGSSARHGALIEQAIDQGILGTTGIPLCSEASLRASLDTPDEDLRRWLDEEVARELPDDFHAAIEQWSLFSVPSPALGARESELAARRREARRKREKLEALRKAAKQRRKQRKKKRSE